MHRLQELVRLHRLGLTERRAAKELRIGRNTAREYRRALQAAGVLEGSPDELPELESLKALVMKALPSRPALQQVSKLEAWQAEVEALLEKRLGPQAIYDRLRLEHGSCGRIEAHRRLVGNRCGARSSTARARSRARSRPLRVAHVSRRGAGELRASELFINRQRSALGGAGVGWAEVQIIVAAVAAGARIHTSDRFGADEPVPHLGCPTGKPALTLISSPPIGLLLWLGWTEMR
jgi:hypothetical protein